MKPINERLNVLLYNYLDNPLYHQLFQQLGRELDDYIRQHFNKDLESLEDELD